MIASTARRVAAKLRGSSLPRSSLNFLRRELERLQEKFKKRSERIAELEKQVQEKEKELADAQKKIALVKTCKDTSDVKTSRRIGNTVIGQRYEISPIIELTIDNKIYRRAG